MLKKHNLVSFNNSLQLQLYHNSLYKSIQKYICVTTTNQKFSLIFSSENKEFFIFGKTLDDIKKKIVDVKAATRYGWLDHEDKYGKGNLGALSTLFGGRPNSVEELRSRLIVRERDLRSDFFMNEDAFSGFDENSARTLLAKMQKQQQKVNTKHSTWQAFFDEQANQYGKKESEWISKFVQENDVMTASVKNVTDAQEAARLAAVRHNAELKNLTIGAKAATVGLKALALVGNMLFDMAIGALISLVIQGIYNLTHRVEIAAQTLEESKSELAETKSEIKSVNDELQTTVQRISELEKKDSLTFTEQEELDKLKEQNNELERRKQILEAQEKVKQKQVTEDFEKAFGKAQNSNTGTGGAGTYIRDENDEILSSTGNESEYIDFEFAKYKQNQDELEKLQDEYADDLSNKKFLKKKERIEKEQAEIQAYLQSKTEEYGTMSDGIDYGMSDESDAALDWINNFMDRFNIIINGEGGKTTAFNRIIGKDEFKDTYNELKNLGEVTEDTFSADKYKDFVAACNDAGISIEDLVGLFQKTEDAAESAAESVENLSVSISDLSKAEDGVSKINSAFKEMHDNGVISMGTISGIAEAFEGTNGLDEYIEKLKNAKQGSDEWRNALNDLLYDGVEQLVGGTEKLASMTEQEIANMLKSAGVANSTEVAHSMLTQAKIKAKLATFDFINATEQERTALYAELEALGLTKSAVESLSAAYANAQRAMTEISKLGTVGRINLLKAELEAVKNSVEAYNLLAGKYTTATGDTSAEAQRNINTNMKLGNDYGKQAGALLNYGYALDKINAAMSKVDSFSPVTPSFSGEIDTGKSGGGSSGGESKKEPAAWEDATDAIIRRIKSTGELIQKQEQVYASQAELIDTEKQYAEAAKLTNDELWLKKQRLAEIKSAQDQFHNEAQWIRNNTAYNTEPWFDDNAEATEAYINLLNSLRENEDERATVEDIFSTIQKYKKAFVELDEQEVTLRKEIYDTDKKHDEILKSGLEAKFESRLSDSDDWIKFKENFDDLSLEDKAQAYGRIINYSREFLNEIENSPFYNQAEKDEIWNKYYSKIKEYAADAYKTLKDIYTEDIEYRTAKEEAYLDIRKQEFDLQNKLAEAEKNAKTALRTSLIGTQYLDLETRRLVYNEDDYKAEIGTIKRISDYISNLSSEYYRKIQNLSKDDIKLKEQITNEYKRQLEMKERELEIAQREVDLQKKKDQLNNVLAERNVRQIVNGKWEWVADTDKVREATEAFADAEYELQNAKKQAQQQMVLDQYSANIDMLNVQKSNVDNFCNIVGTAGVSIDNFGNAIDVLIAKISSLANGDNPVRKKSSSKVNVGKVMSIAQKSSGMQNVINRNFERSGITSKLSKIKSSIKNRYASGTDNAKRGWAELVEKGDEVMITNDGIFRNMSGGEVVFSNPETHNLKDLAQINTGGLFGDFMQKVNIPTTSRTETVDKSVTLNGDIVVQNPADFNEFTRKLTQAFKKPRN